MQLIALIWGILAILAALVAFFPCLGALNWLVVPFAVVGLILAVVVFASAPAGSRGNAKAALALTGIATVMGVVRLAIGGGVL